MTFNSSSHPEILNGSALRAPWHPPKVTTDGHEAAPAALRGAFEQLDQAVHELKLTPSIEVLESHSYGIGRLIDHGFLDRADATDVLTQVCTLNGLSAEAGPDMVQEAIAAGFLAGAAAAEAERDSSGPPVLASSPASARQESFAEPSSKVWPVLQGRSFGLVGEIGRLATQNSEADPNAVMATALAWGAAIFGRNRYMNVGDTIHHARHFCALVGASSRARKGTSLDPVRRIFKAVEAQLQSHSTLSFPSGVYLKLSHGPLSSGEGLLNAIRDKRDEQDIGGVEDKRLLCLEGEFGSVLRACQRQGNTLSTTLRVAWDGWTIEPLTKHDKVRATDPHICVVGHITNHELKDLLTVSDLWNGFANRFLWTAVRRRGSVPFPKPMPDADVDRISKEIAQVVKYAHDCAGDRARLTLSNSAQNHWADCYGEITAEHPGILGAVTSRAEAQTLRLAMSFALFDGADRVELSHLEDAITFWRFAFDSAAYIFGGAELDPVAQRILDALAVGPKTQTEVSGLFDRHLPKGRLGGVLNDLQDRGRITLSVEKTGGAPRKIWKLNQSTATPPDNDREFQQALERARLADEEAMRCQR